MAGRIKDEDITLVRERARIDEVVSQHVTLRNAGGGSMKGLCPFHDEKSPSFHVTPSRSFYHCLAGETEVITWNGIRPIRELVPGIHRVLSAHNSWVEAPFRSYGRQRLFKITATRNRQVKEIFATDEHRWFVRSGKAGAKRRVVLTRDLRQGHRLAFVYPRNRVSRTTPSPFGVAHGFTYGDGTLSGNGAMALLCPPKDLAMLKWFPISMVTSRDEQNLLVHHLPKFFKSLPDIDESTSYLYGWLAGYFAADGCVASDGTVILNSSVRSNLEFVRLLCTRLGIATFGITEQRRPGFEGRELSSLYRVHLVNDDLNEDFFLINEHRRRFVEARKSFTRRGWIVQSVEPTDRYEEVFCAEVEDGHAFTLADNILTGNCFGCGEGGDVFDFVMRVEGLTFVDTVERLAGRYGVQLRYSDADAPGAPRRDASQRPRLLEAHKLAAEFYVSQLFDSPDAKVARQFLSERGFDRAAAEQFGVGFAPRAGDALYKHLRQRGLRDEELVTAGLVGQSGRGPYDRFRGRLLWPIREVSGEVVGFGARRLFDDDRIEAKYLNTPETPIYKKSHLLYGVDLARREIARRKQAVVVEGYTDVMACHLSGVETAVATCGTAFGEDHGRVLRRLLLDHEQFRGEVIFTFDGDEAGQRAALRAFQGDQQFVAQTYVAVEPEGLDPCDVRINKGDAEVRELVARRVPLYRFVLKNVLERYDLDRADSRVDAMRSAAGLVASVRDRSKIDAFARELAGMVGLDVDEVRAEVRRAASRRPSEQRAARPGVPATEETGPARPTRPDPREPRFAAEREALQLVVQHPELVGEEFTELGDDDFTHPTFAGVRRAVQSVGGTAAAASGEWVSRLREHAEDEFAQSALAALAVEPLRISGPPDRRLADSLLARLQEVTALRRIEQVKSRLQRTNPVEEQSAYNKMFGELVALEQHRRSLRERAIGGGL
ncbi:MAG TPA: DNA primase [Nocardioidaceae bacterium]|nr:DNA primase [Nocardioidaceae bacterium]